MHCRRSSFEECSFRPRTSPRIRCHRIFRALLAPNFLPSEFSRLERVVADASEYKYTRVVSKNREIYRVHGTARSLLAVTCEGFNVFMIDLF